MRKIRVLVVDDSAVIRRVVTGELSADPEIEVVGAAANGKIALAKMAQVNPDLVILDVEMPDMDGLETLARLRKDYPRLPVIMFSALTEQGAAATLDALALGATDYFTKPAGRGGLEDSRRVIREELVPAIKALCGANGATSEAGSREAGPGRAGPASREPATALTRRCGRVEVVAIGVSTGGPNALAEVFRALPAAVPVPILIVQHMPPMFTRLLAQRLTADAKVPVEEATSGVALRPGRAWIAPGGFHMIVVRDGPHVRAILHQEPPENSCRPAADPLFRSVAKVYGASCLAVVLTGMGQDGLRGCETIREAGGQVLVQDEATSVVWGMPGAVARAGLADKVLPLSMVGNEIVRRIGGIRR
jgi:two-component system chemotaxis response regulator CheB